MIAAGSSRSISVLSPTLVLLLAGCGSGDDARTTQSGR